MRVRLSRLSRYEGQEPYKAEGIATGTPEVGKPFKITRADGQTVSTTDIAEIVSVDAGGIVFRTLTGTTWVAARLDLELGAAAERMERA